VCRPSHHHTSVAHPPAHANLDKSDFAKVYWRTKYCLLQKFGSECDVPPSRLARLKQIARKYGLTDVRPGNIRCVGGVGKIVDATVVRRERGGV
jgi:hypothetical protein